MAETSYDRIKYPSHPFPQTHPDRLCAMAMLHGIPAAPPTSCRYLEVGCGSGMNLLAMAATLPGSRFHGIDLAQGAINEAQSALGALGLTNLDFECGDIATPPAPLGEYDYIVAHGVYSWVPESVRAALLRLIQAHLAPQGVAYISYNTFPGGHIRQMVRAMTRHHVRHHQDPTLRLQQARALLRFIAQAKAGPPTYAPLLAAEIEHFDNASEGLLHHDDLADVSQPFYLHEVLAEAAGHGLRFLSEATLHEMQFRTYGAQVIETLSALPVEEREQYLDFIKCRRFRQTLFVREGVAIDRASHAKRFESLFLATDAQREPQPGENGAVSFRRAAARVTTSSPAGAVAIEALAAAWPAALSIPELLARINLPATEQAAAAPEARAAREEVLSVLIEITGVGLIDLRSSAVPCAASVSAHPRASRLARWQCASGRPLTTLRHTSVRTEGDLTPVLLSLCDGTRDHRALAEGIIAEAAAGRISIAIDGATDHGADTAALMRKVVDLNLAGALAHLQRLALLEA